MSVIDTIIICQPREEYEAPQGVFRCPQCGTLKKPIRKRDASYVCPECGYNGEIEDWG